ncbi:microvitellogenin-like [Bombyx mandarina]|uniref:Microvitellogenin-like n=1 Tax=Bombyx mandarina TaxID=7092 RepID=A0A6J2JJC0_BOMMA|nr:microvitellogenin-like [Bombyx mandarina]
MGLKEFAVILMCALAANANIIIDDTGSTVAATVSSTDSSSTEATVSEKINLSLASSDIASTSAKNIEDELYNEVVSRDFDKAVYRTAILYGAGHDSIISNVVHRLINDGQSQIFDYAYKLTASRGTFIVRALFPIEIRMHEDLLFVKIISYKYDFALKYSRGVDFAGDKTAYGDSDTSTRFKVTWKFVPYWIGDRVYFKIRPIDIAYFLKLGNTRDRDGDHGAYGSTNHDTDRHLWYVKPVRHNGKLLFYIINKEYDELLKLGKSKDWDGDRVAYGHSEKDFNPDKFAWYIKLI